MKITTQGAQGNGVSLLIVDDDPDSMHQLCSALSASGLEILRASDSENGLGIACRRRPQIVLTTPQPGVRDMVERIVAMDSATHVIRLGAHYSGNGGDDGDHRDKQVPLPELRQRVARLAREVSRQRHVQTRMHIALVSSGGPAMEVFKGETREILKRFLSNRLSFPQCIAALDAALAGTIPTLTDDQMDPLRAILLTNNETVMKEMERRGTSVTEPGWRN